MTILINLIADGRGIAYSVPLFGFICEAQNGTRETDYDFAEVGTEDMTGCGHFWQFLQVEDDLGEGSKPQAHTDGCKGADNET